MATPVSPAVLAGPEGVDPRSSTVDGPTEEYRITDNDLIDANINSQPLEVYMYYAAIERENERNDTTPDPVSPWVGLYRRMRGTKQEPVPEPTSPAHDVGNEKNSEKSPSVEGPAEKTGGATVTVTERERQVAYRALRTASWQGVFFLITTDILGPSSAPFALSLLGFGGGVLVYFFFYILAFLGGQILWRMYLEVDSSKFPCKNYADLGERTFGRWVRHAFNILQSLQLLLNVGIITLGNGQILAAVIKFQLCFSVLNLLFMLAGMILGQIRSLRNFAWFANLAVWLNIIVIILTVVGVGIFDPVPELNDLPPGPVVTQGFTGIIWNEKMVGVQQAVFAYGGAMIFVEFMAEMKRPHDFWKAAFYSQTFIFFVYLFFGVYVYAFQGQFTYIIPNLGISNFAFQTSTNVIGLASALIAATLYGNIGIKVLYINVLQAYFRAPEMTTRWGRVAWIFLTVFYWAFAFVFASAIPQLASMVTLVGAVCILQFTYTFPPILYLGHLMQKHALVADQRWEPGMAPGSTRIDTWRDFSRWKRGFAKWWYLKIFLFLVFLGALATAGLGAFAGVESIIDTFAKAGATSSFSCRAPNQT